MSAAVDQLFEIASGLNQRFPEGNNPFEIMNWLLEECGELAAQVNHYEGRGVKREKHGEPDKAKLAKEVMCSVARHKWRSTRA